MKEQFRYKRFSEKIRIKLSTGLYFEGKSSQLIDAIIQIVEKYQEQDISMTLRQLYYQLVSSDIIPNDIKVYSKLSNLVTDARYNGLLDWAAIEDRVRIPNLPSHWDSIKDIVETAIHSFKVNRHADQDCYIEIFTEKDALFSIIEPITRKWMIPFCVNRGYASATAMYSLYQRIYRKIEVERKSIILLYIGDHDPSGLDMIRDIHERLLEFLFCEKNHPLLKIIPIALTLEQIKKYSPPPNPAKITDPRAKWYIKKFGQKSWEVDALPPDILQKTIEDNIFNYIDIERYNTHIVKENKEKSKLKDLLNKL